MSSSEPPSEPDEAEAVFRRIMARVTDEAWEPWVHEEAVAAMYDVLHLGRRRRQTGRCQPWCWRDTRPTGASNRTRRRPNDNEPTA
jgi:hypothetical protein